MTIKIHMQFKKLIQKIFKLGKKTSDDELLGDAKNVLMKGTLKTDFDFFSYSKKNIFNLLSSNSNYGFYYWPYGYLFRHVKWGAPNDLGFRCKENFYEINDLHKDKYLIGFFGGSTGYDILVSNQETLVFYLEQKLNQDQQLKKKYGNFKIINFSQPGNLLMNQMINYIQFGKLVDLKLIISHNSGNDFGTGLINDPKILKKYKIAYVDLMEVWAKKIHDAHDVDIEMLRMDKYSKNFRKVEVKTDADTVIQSYIFRCLQFEKMIINDNKIFISGIMPHVFSKKNLSDDEKKIFENYNPYYHNVNKYLPDVYKKLFEKYYDRISHQNLVNLHKFFYDLPTNVSHFGDVVHLLSPGNKIAAHHYYEKIKQILLNNNV